MTDLISRARLSLGEKLPSLELMLSSLPSRTKIAQSDPVNLAETMGFFFSIVPMRYRDLAYHTTTVPSCLLPTNGRVEDIPSVRTEACVPAIAGPKTHRNFFDEKSIRGNGEDEPQLPLRQKLERGLKT